MGLRLGLAVGLGCSGVSRIRSLGCDGWIGLVTLGSGGGGTTSAGCASM